MHDDYWVYDEDNQEYIVRDLDISRCGNYKFEEDCDNCSFRGGCNYYKSR